MCKSSMKFKNYFKVNKAFKPIKKSQNFLKNKPDCPNICKKDLIVTCYVLCNIFSYTHIVFVFSSGKFLYLSDVFSPFFFLRGILLSLTCFFLEFCLFFNNICFTISLSEFCPSKVFYIWIFFRISWSEFSSSASESMGISIASIIYLGISFSLITCSHSSRNTWG